MTFCDHYYIIYLWQQKAGDEMSPRTGRPKSENPKSRQFRMRLTEEEFSNLEQVAKQKSMTKTEVVMRGIELVKSEKTK